MLRVIFKIVSFARVVMVKSTIDFIDLTSQTQIHIMKVDPYLYLMIIIIMIAIVIINSKARFSY